MSFQLVETTTTRAPRALTRAGQRGKRKVGAWGTVTYDDAPEPSVGGEAEWTHHVWRCSNCRALAVTTGETPPKKCGKCQR